MKSEHGHYIVKLTIRENKQTKIHTFFSPGLTLYWFKIYEA